MTVRDLLSRFGYRFDGARWRALIGDGETPLAAHERRINDEGGIRVEGSATRILFWLSRPGEPFDTLDDREREARRLTAGYVPEIGEWNPVCHPLAPQRWGMHVNEDGDWIES